jgi:DNA polymerase-3 subunit alpha
MQECARLGIPILPPDINRSGADFRVEATPEGKQAIRFALAAVKRVGEAAMRDLAAARDASGPFVSLADLASRVDPKLLNKMQIENLARAGAFECLEKNRARVMAGAETILRRAQADAEERGSGQIGLFGGETARDEPLRLPDVPDWPLFDRLAHEAEAVGFHLSAHPLDTYRKALARLGVTPSALIAERARGGARLKLAGTVVNAKERTTKTGSRMAWVRLSDAQGSYEVTCFSEVLNRSRDLLAEGQAVLVTADARLEGEALRLTATDVEALEKAANGAGGGIRLWIEDIQAVAPIRDILAREGRGRGRVVLVPRIALGQEVEMALPNGWNVGPRVLQAMKVLPGVSAVEEI